MNTQQHVYIMRLWRDGTVSVVFTGTLANAYRYTRGGDWLVGLGMEVYRGRHFIASEPVIRPPEDSAYWELDAEKTSRELDERCGMSEFIRRR